MSTLFRYILCFFGSLLIAGCSALPEIAVPQQTAVHKQMPFERPPPTIQELDPELVFNTLAGEIALQRGEYELAYRHQLQTAILAGDEVAAERAARIATLLKRRDLALEAVERWIELAPNNLAGRQRAVSLYLDAGESEKAFEQALAILAISEARGENGFTSVLAVLSKQQDQIAAMTLMRRLQAIHADDPEAGYAIALISFLRRDYAQAEADIRSVIADRPDWSKGYVLLSRLRKLQDDASGAVEVLKQVLRQDPDEASVNTALARLLVEMSDYEGGYQQFLKINRLAPDDTDALYSLAVLAVQTERYGVAKDHLKRLLEMGSHVDDAAYYLGRIEEQDGHDEVAIGWYKRVSGGDYRFEAMARVAQVLADADRLQEALDWIRNLRVQIPSQSVQLYLMEAKILAQHGSATEVFEVYSHALDAHPDNDDILYARGLYAAELGRLDIVESDLRQVIQHDPNNADALNALGYTFADRSIRFEEAGALIAQALKLKPDSPAILDSMGWLHYRQGNLPLALDYLKKAFTILADGEIGAHLGEVLWIMGDRDGAEAVWKRVLEQDPESRHVRETRGRLVK